MLLTVPDNCRAERSWIGEVLLGDFLGLDYEMRFDDGDSVRISADGKTLTLPDIFLSHTSQRWLSPQSLPETPLQHWNVAASGLATELTDPTMPVLFGTRGFDMHDSMRATLHIDIFGSAFFMLSRYEEAVDNRRDSHDRFPASASLAWKERFLERPIIDEYVEILWTAMQRLWPRLQRRQHQFRTVVTCDVDHPYHPGAMSFRRMIKRTAGEVLRKRSLNDIFRPARNYVAGRYGNWRNDPYYYTVDWIMQVNENAGNTVAFNFIPEITDTRMDDTCPISDPAVKAMMKRIAERKHEIGLHPGYRTYQSKKNIVSGKRKLQQVLDQERIPQRVSGGRQHYLRWSTQTPAFWNAAGLIYDSTLGYADHAGFRCGTCHEFSMYDLHRREALEVRQRPLICMESTVIDYMGCGFTDTALEKMHSLKNAARTVRGNFMLLWHNSSFENERARSMYCDIIR